MNKKFLLGAFAVAGLLASCSSDEMDFGNAPINKTQGRVVLDRPVEFVSGSTRFNELTAQFEEGDKFGLYLMDEFTEPLYYAHNGDGNMHHPYYDVNGDGIVEGEMQNANLTHWRNQNVWWSMYSLVDYIQTNYPYVYNATAKTWSNPAAQLIEGNYIVGFPMCETATNRRDLWYPIHSNVDLKTKPSDKYAQFFYNVESEFELGYTQIYRDEEAATADGKFQIKLQLHPVLSRIKFILYNQSASDFMPTKLVFKKKDNSPVPTIALIKPASSNLQEMLEANEKDVIEKNECNVDKTVQYFDRDKQFTQEMAREMITYIDPTKGYIPYKCEGEQAETAYEFVYNFPAETIIPGNRPDQAPENSVACVYMGIPDVLLGEEYEVFVYGKKYDPTIPNGQDKWRPGLFKSFGSSDNQKFELEEVPVWNEGKEIPTATLKFDDQAFVFVEEMEVSKTEDLITLISGRLATATNTKDIDFTIRPFGAGLDITQEVEDILAAWEKKTGHKITMNFVAEGPETPVNLNVKDFANRSTFDRSNVTINAEQTFAKGGVFNKIVNNSVLNVTSNISVWNTLTNMPEATLNVTNANIYSNGSDLINYGEANIGNAEIGMRIDNHNLLNIKTGTVRSVGNTRRLVINQSSQNCDACGAPTNPLVTVSAYATLTATTNGNVSVSGTLNADRSNVGTIEINAGGKVEYPANNYNGTIAAAIRGTGELSANYHNAGEPMVAESVNWTQRATAKQAANQAAQKAAEKAKKQAENNAVAAVEEWIDKLNTQNDYNKLNYAGIAEAMNAVTVENDEASDSYQTDEYRRVRHFVEDANKLIAEMKKDNTWTDATLVAKIKDLAPLTYGKITMEQIKAIYEFCDSYKAFVIE